MLSWRCSSSLWSLCSMCTYTVMTGLTTSRINNSLNNVLAPLRAIKRHDSIPAPIAAPQTSSASTVKLLQENSRQHSLIRCGTSSHTLRRPQKNRRPNTVYIVQDDAKVRLVFLSTNASSHIVANLVYPPPSSTAISHETTASTPYEMRHALGFNAER